jgi:hypothetical protein
VSSHPPATPATPKKRDPGLEEIIGDLRARARRRWRGRILVVLELIDGQVTRRRVEESAMTEEDYKRLMQEPPWPRGVQKGLGRVNPPQEDGTGLVSR